MNRREAIEATIVSLFGTLLPEPPPSLPDIGSWSIVLTVETLWGGDTKGEETSLPCFVHNQPFETVEEWAKKILETDPIQINAMAGNKLVGVVTAAFTKYEIKPFRRSPF